MKTGEKCLYKNIILVDDDPINNFINKRVIQASNVCQRILLFTNGIDAINYIQNENPVEYDLPDLLIVDVKMPVMDGFEFIQRVNKLPHEKTSHFRIFMLSSSQDPRDLQKSRDLGVKNYISKPLSEEKLKQLAFSL